MSACALFCTFCCLPAYSGFQQDAALYNKQGVEYLQAKKFHEAIAVFEKAYRLVPDNNTVKHNLSYAYAGLAAEYALANNWKQATSYASQAYQLNTSDAVLKTNLALYYSYYAMVLFEQSNFPKAKENFEQALRYDDNNWQAHLGLGKLKYNEGSFPEAASHWKKAFAIKPDLPEIKDRLAMLEKEIALGGKFRQLELSYFDIQYEGGKKEDLARKAIQILHKAYNDVGYAFDYYPQDKTTVIIYTGKQFQETTGEPKWAAGGYDGVVRAVASDFASEAILTTTLYHEYTHAVLYKKFGGNFPYWLDEGLAQLLEPGGKTLSPEDVAYLKKGLAKAKFMSIGRLDRALRDEKDESVIQLAYVEARTLLQYMDERYHMYRIRSLLEELKQGAAIDTAIKKVFFVDIPHLEKDWLDWFAKKYGPVAP